MLTQLTQPLESTSRQRSRFRTAKLQTLLKVLPSTMGQRPRRKAMQMAMTLRKLPLMALR